MRALVKPTQDNEPPGDWSSKAADVRAHWTIGAEEIDRLLAAKRTIDPSSVSQGSGDLTLDLPLLGTATIAVDAHGNQGAFRVTFKAQVEIHLE